MPLTAFDLISVLIVVDVQKGTAGRPHIHSSPSSQTNVAGWTKVPPELGQQPSEIIVNKCSCGTFARTDLEDHLKARSVPQVVTARLSTPGHVGSTARQAFEEGFHPPFPPHAMTDSRKEVHEYSIRSVFPRLGETGTTQKIFSPLKKRSATA